MIGERDTDMKNTYDLIIVGGGPAGLAAGIQAKKAGVEDLLILERDHELGGILNQCIHNGFGLHTFKEELTGPEYAQRYIDQAMELSIPYKLNTMVLDIARDGKEKVVTIMNREEGLVFLRTKAVILAMGCRERPRGALNIPGYRPAGIYTAGTAQRLVNMEGYMPGREVVILGSGDIGLIMARRMTLEGAKVKVVAELMPYSGGLQRNIVQCLEDFNIPLKLSHTVTDIQGKERVTGITIAQVDENRKPIPGTEEFYSCDTLLLSNAADVMRIIIGDTVMLQRDGYFIKALTVYGQTFLGEHRSLSLEEAEIDAGYSSIPATSMAKRANVVTVDPDRMREGEKTVYYRLSVRYVIGNGISIYPARLSSFIKLFPDKKKELRRYARERRIDFGDKMDLIDFFYYCTSQPSIRREAVEKVTPIRMTFLPSAWKGRQ